MGQYGWGEGRQLRRCNLFATGAMRERVARVVHRSHLLKAGEKADTYAIRTAGAPGPTNAAIARMPPTLCQSVARLLLTAPLLSEAVALHRGQCDTLRRDA